jgi:hypothetical protein
MKTQSIKVQFYQLENESTNLSFELTMNEGDSQSLIFGTLLNEVFFHINSAKQVGSKLFNLSQPVLLKVETNTHYFDFSELNKSITQKLKLGNSPKAKRTFARRVMVALEVINHLPQYVTIEDLIIDLSKQIDSVE